MKLGNNTAHLVGDSEVNYWPEFGTLQYFEVIYMIFIILLGTIGNLIVISSIVLDKKVHSSGNIFIINLAVADALVCSVTLPCILAAIVKSRRIVDGVLCQFVGFIVTSTCICSLANMALVALNRYWAIVRLASYREYFTKNIGIFLTIFSWIWSFIITMPTLTGWGGLTYDAKSLVCAWHDAASFSYSVFLMSTAVVLPLIVIVFSYYQIFRKVHKSGSWARNLGEKSVTSLASFNSTNKNSIKRERNLSCTLLTAVVIFFICWTPYALHVLINPEGIKPHLKKFLVWLALTNSCLNFIIYGAMNPAFKRRYKKLFNYVVQCHRDKTIHSDENPVTGANVLMKL